MALPTIDLPKMLCLMNARGFRQVDC